MMMLWMMMFRGFFYKKIDFASKPKVAICTVLLDVR
jgi:hypothetical protein